MTKKLGLDLGSSSIGWAIREEDNFKTGVVIFESGMVKGRTGYSSPTFDRRTARSRRNLYRAHKYRKWELLKRLCINQEYSPLSNIELNKWRKYEKGKTRKFPESKNFLDWLACNFSYENGVKYKNPYELRVKTLDSKLSKHELGRVLYHLVQRRGYKDIGENDKETEKQKQRRNEEGFQSALNSHRTLAESLHKEFLSKGKRARNQYPYRCEYEKELMCILKKQGYNLTERDEFVNKVWKSIVWQRPLRSQKGTIGKCTFYPKCNRSSKSHPSFEVFRAWQFINTIKYSEINNPDVEFEIELKLKEELFNEIFIRKANFKFERVRSFLDKKLGKKVKYNYPMSSNSGKYETTISGMPFCAGIMEIIPESLQSINEIEKINNSNAPKILDNYSVLDLWHALFSFDLDYIENKRRSPEKNPYNSSLTESQFKKFIKLKKSIVKEYANLSVKAINKTLPYLKEGYLYNDAITLSKLSDVIDDEVWISKLTDIKKILYKVNKTYKESKLYCTVANNLINKHKGDVEEDLTNNDTPKAYKDYDYKLNDEDIEEVKRACANQFGNLSWKMKSEEEKTFIVHKVKTLYQEYFEDKQRNYRVTPTNFELLKSELEKINIQTNIDEINLLQNIISHSNRPNIYGDEVYDKLKLPRTNSIKNPMFNKSMFILRRVINQMIQSNLVDKSTEVVIELARELNDNNKRIAIERFQRDRENLKNEIVKTLNEFGENNREFNRQKQVRNLELWTEQIFHRDGEKGLLRDEILKERDPTKRYQLWIEQKGRCMYTGKCISLSKLFSNEIEIEHTIPKSVLPDNTMMNLTICDTHYNRNIKMRKLPTQCPNYTEPNASYDYSIKQGLKNWEKIRDRYRMKYESRKRSKGIESEEKKNKRIQDRHYYKMYFDYWNEKVKRFTEEEVNESWARRQLTDTQLVSKYSREFLKTYFKKVTVQKGEVTSEFRKIYGIQGESTKDRSLHTHHAIDASVLTLIPTNSSHRLKLLKQSSKKEESGNKLRIKPYPRFNSQSLIKKINNQTLVVYFNRNRVTQQTYKRVRIRGKIDYIKDKKGDFVYNKGNKIPKFSRGDTIRARIFQDAFLGKIRSVCRDDNGNPIRINGDWKFKKGKDEYDFVIRKPIEDVIKTTKKIVDPRIRRIVDENKENPTDFQGNPIRHVRVINNSKGRKVKDRTNYKSNQHYKNYYYSLAGEIPYGIIIENKNKRKLIPVPTNKISKFIKSEKEGYNFDPKKYLELEDIAEINCDVKLLKVGQHVIVLDDDHDKDNLNDINFLSQRLYRIKQFEEDGRIKLAYHLNALSSKDFIKDLRSKYLIGIENDLAINSRSDVSESDRFEEIKKNVNSERYHEIEGKFKGFKEWNSKIKEERKTPFLRISIKSSNFRFLYENYDFEINILGDVSLRNLKRFVL